MSELSLKESMAMQSIKDTFNDNDRYNRPRTNVSIASYEVDTIADQLVQTFLSPQSRPFYCKVAHSLTPKHIEELVDTSKNKGKYPAKLFNYLARQEIARVSAISSLASKPNDFDKNGDRNG